MNAMHSSDLWQLAKDDHKARLLDSERSRQIKRALTDNIFAIDDPAHPAQVRILPVTQPAADQPHQLGPTHNRPARPRAGRRMSEGQNYARASWVHAATSRRFSSGVRTPMRTCCGNPNEVQSRTTTPCRSSFRRVAVADVTSTRKKLEREGSTVSPNACRLTTSSRFAADTAFVDHAR